MWPLKTPNSVNMAAGRFTNLFRKRLLASEAPFEENPEEKPKDEKFIYPQPDHNNRYKIRIYDEKAIDYRIPPQRYEVVNRLLFEALYDYIVQNPDEKVPIFTCNERYCNDVVIDCDSKSTVEFIQYTIENMPAKYPLAESYKVIPLLRTPNPLKIRKKIPLFTDVNDMIAEQILTVMRAQNTDIPMQKWKIREVRKDPTSDSINILFEVDAMSRRILKNKEFIIIMMYKVKMI